MTRRRWLLPRAGSIEARLFWILGGVALGITFLLNLLWLPASVGEIRSSQADLQRVSARAVRAQIRIFLQDKEEALRAELRVLHPLLEEESATALRDAALRFLQREPAFDEIGLLDATGRVLVVAGRTLVLPDPDLGVNLARSLAGTPVRPTSRSLVAWGTVATSETSEPVVPLALPMRELASTSGAVVYGVLRIRSLWELTGELRLPHGGRAYVVGGSGRLIAADDPNLVLRQLAVADRPLVRRLIEAPSIEDVVEGRYLNERGAAVVATGITVGSPPWAVVVEQSESLLWAPVLHKLWFAGVLSLVGIVAGLAFARIVSRRLIQPIIRLGEGAGLIGSGRLEHRVAVEARDEIGDLATQFNLMADRLRESHATLERRIEDKTRDLSALLEINRELSRFQALDTLLATIAETCGRLVGSDSVGFRVVEGDELVVAGTTASARHQMLIPRLKVGESLTGLVALTGEPLVVNDLARDARAKPELAKAASGAGYRAWVGVPVNVGDRVAGVLSIRTRRETGFSGEDVALVTAFAGHAAVALENARLYQGLEQKNRHLEILFEAARLVTVSRDLDDVLPALARAAATLVETDAASIRLLDRTESALVVAANHGVSEAFAARPPLTFRDSARLREVVHGRTMAFEDVAGDHECVNRDELLAEGFASTATVPLLSRENTVGILSVFSRSRRRYTAQDLELLALFANLAAIAIENKRAEENLRRAHAETEQLLASISWIMLAIDADGVVRQWNAAAETALDVPATQAVGRALADLDLAWDWASITGRIAECRDGGAPSRFSEVTYTRRDRQRGVLGVTLMPIRQADDARPGCLLLASDVTDRKVLEGQLAQAQKLESIGQLAAGVAHEINTPIQFIGDNVEFLRNAVADLWRLQAAHRALREGAGSAPETTERLADEIRRLERDLDVDFLAEEMPNALAQTLGGVERVASIVRALKEFAHPDQKEMVATDLNQAIQSTLTVARNEIKYVAEVETDLGSLPPVICNPGEMNQVLLNILVNAAHAIGDQVRAEGGRGTIRIVTSREANQVVIAISDTGGGIPESAQSKIFDPFFTTKEVGRGTGQGLAISRTVVDRHHGTLTFETEIGRGTTFFIRLPVNYMGGLDGPPKPPERSSRPGAAVALLDSA